METQGTQSDTSVGVVKRQCADLQPFLQLPSNTVLCRPDPGGYNRVPRPATPADQPGERDGRTVPRYITSVRESARRPAARSNSDLTKSSPAGYYLLPTERSTLG